MKAKAWSVITKADEVLVEHYSGPDKSKAREVAAKLLKEEKKHDGVMVVKVSQVHVLTAGDLKASLPKDIF